MEAPWKKWKRLLVWVVRMSVRCSATGTISRIHFVNCQFSWNFTKTLVSGGFEIKTVTSLLERVCEALSTGGQCS